MNIIGRRKFWIIFSAILVLVSIPVIIFFHPRLGIDYTGGSLFELQTVSPMTISQVRDLLKDTSEGKGLLIQESGSNAFIIRTSPLEGEKFNTFEGELQSKLPGSSIVRHETIGATVGKDLTRKAIIGIVLASILIVAYIAYAFRSVPRSVSAWSFGTVAVIALVHDLIVAFAVFSVFALIAGYELDSLAVVAALTTLGFSVHDTIVVFDRIRENVIKNPQSSFAEVANMSVNQTFARSLNTSLTAILVLVSMIILGGGTIRPFVLFLAIGITVGTYSSIFVASPLVVFWQERQRISLS